MAKIMITGIAGFIGFHLAQKLKTMGHVVYGIDNFNDYYDTKLKFARAEKLQEAGIPVLMRDLKDPFKPNDDCFNIGGSGAPDLVFNLAAYAGVRHSLVEPRKYIDNNIVGVYNLIEACNMFGVKKVIYASTSCVMAGNPLPWKEDEKLGYQLNPYGYSKATNEAQFMAPNGLDVAIGLRFFTVYGPWGRPDMALFSFTKNIVEGKPIQLFNYGDMIRDFTYVDDIIQGCCIVIQKALDEEQYKDVYNIGYGQQVQLVDFVNHIEENLGIKAIRELVPKHPADTHETWSDTTKLQALGYKPTTSIEVGVKNFIKWYKEYYNV